jgi:hypothetical protein
MKAQADPSEETHVATAFPKAAVAPSVLTAIGKLCAAAGVMQARVKKRK